MRMKWHFNPPIDFWMISLWCSVIFTDFHWLSLIKQWFSMIHFRTGSDETLFHEGFIRRIRLSSSRQKCFVEEVVKDASAQLVFSILIWRYVSSKVHSIMKPVLVMNWEKLRKRWAHVEKVPLKPLRWAGNILIGIDYATLITPS